MLGDNLPTGLYRDKLGGSRKSFSIVQIGRGFEFYTAAAVQHLDAAGANHGTGIFGHTVDRRRKGLERRQQHYGQDQTEYQKLLTSFLHGANPSESVFRNLEN